VRNSPANCSRRSPRRRRIFARKSKELAADPSVAGAKLALESIKSAVLPFMLSEEHTALIKKTEESAATKVAEVEKTLAEANLKLKALEDEKLQIEVTLKEIGYKLFVEQILDGNAEGRAMIGDLKQYPSAAEIKAKAEAVKAELAKKKAPVAESVKPVVAAAPVAGVAELQKELQIAATRADRAEAQIETFEAKLAKTQKIVEAYEDKLNKTEEALAKAIETQEELSTQLYAERKLTNNPKAGKIRSVIESSNARSTEQVDQVVEQFREPIRDPEDLARYGLGSEQGLGAE
jgi:DNA repair exonuclease SbcCD ATPase subunit